MTHQLNWKIFKHFAVNQRYAFSFQDVMTEFPKKQPVQLANTLKDMVEEGMLCKISRDIYHIIPVNADPETYVPEGPQVAKYMMLHREYYLGYASAMRIHGLSHPSEAMEYVVSEKQMKPAIRSFRGVSYQFIQHDATRFFGFSDIWINQYEKAMVSDLEKTIVDVATKPGFCGGIIEVGDALIKAEDRIDQDKLLYYFARNRNKSAKKRFLFLTDVLDLEWTKEHDRMMQELGTGITLLDPTAPDRGRRRTKFGLKINVDPREIQKKVLG